MSHRQTMALRDIIMRGVWLSVVPWMESWPWCCQWDDTPVVGDNGNNRMDAGRKKKIELDGSEGTGQFIQLVGRTAGSSNPIPIWSLFSPIRQIGPDWNLDRSVRSNF